MGKVVDINWLKEELEKKKTDGNSIVHCHGCFDLMHPGHIKHFQSAKKLGDILVVTISPDEYIDKGPGRPVYTQTIRAESIAALECVDYVAVNKWPTAYETILYIKPDIYVKGKEFENLKDKTGKLQQELKALKKIDASIEFTQDDVVFSSTKLINEYILKK